MPTVATPCKLELRFMGGNSPRLDRMILAWAEEEPIISVRGDGPIRDGRKLKRFDWSNAVRALSELFVRRHAACAVTNGEGVLQGNRGTSAASLNDALAKGRSRETRWIDECFGSTFGGRSHLSMMLRRRNADFKMPNEPVSIWIRSEILAPSATRVFLDDHEITHYQSLMRIAKSIADEWLPRGARKRRGPRRRGTVGVFGVALRVVDGQTRILVNVRTDQEEQRQLAGLPKESTVLIVDLPGGRWLASDKTEEEGLRREIHEETGCEIEHR